MKIRSLTTLAALLAFAACGDGTGPKTGAQVSLTFASGQTDFLYQTQRVIR